MDDEDEELEDEDLPRPLRWSNKLLFSAFCSLVAEIAQAWQEFFGLIALMVASDFRHTEQQQLMHAEAAREIETLTQGD